MARALRTEALTEARLAQLAHEPGVTVYKYEYDAPAGSMSATAQLSIARAIIAEFDELTHVYPSECSEQLRERVLKSGGLQFQRFQHLYAKVFALITQRVYTAADAEYVDKTRVGVLYMLQVKVNAGADADTAPTSLLTSTVMTTCSQLAMRDVQPDDDISTAQTIPIAGDGSGTPATECAPTALPPLRRDVLGPCLVRQSTYTPK